ncbi:type II toxin-antitoxin system HigB family toxin [Microcystis sp. 0824]|uniref:type II toxin-antitoxin system HigB family toxin n=1 Tax=Microcystis sp. 0824 TaxID=1502726 RepID=UPI001E45DF38|nr:type II toxin-antitoxin system HigB family toxin [Microcystis sp. 0824]
MPVISRRKLNEFAERYPETKSALKEWYQKIKTGQFQSIAELRTIFPSADKVGKMTVFNIGGNKIRLIAAIHYIDKKFIALPKLVRYIYFLPFCLLPLAFCLKPITFVPQQTEKRYIFEKF